jgi:hypothetical protein
MGTLLPSGSETYHKESSPIRREKVQKVVSHLRKQSCNDHQLEQRYGKETKRVYKPQDFYQNVEIFCRVMGHLVEWSYQPLGFEVFQDAQGHQNCDS